MGYSTVRRIMREGLTDPRNLDGIALWNSTRDVTDLTTDTGIKLWADKSGNSSTNVLCLNGVAGNNASFAALTAFGTGNFTVSIRMRVLTLAATQTVLGSAANGFAFKINTTGKVVSSKTGVADNTVSVATVAVYQLVTITYVRSGTSGIYYFDGVADNTISDSVDYTVGLSLLGQATASNPTTGNIHWARVYNAALTAPQVLADSNGTVQSGCVFNADISVVAKLATSFTESSSNAATVTINTSGATGARISGARDLYQGTAANQPILTIAAAGNYLTFDGSNDYLKAAAFALAQPETVYFVGSQVTWLINESWFDGGTTGARYMNMYQSVTTPTISLNAGTAGAVTAAPAVGTNVIITAKYQSATSSLRVNRGAASVGDAGTRDANGFTIGSNSDATGLANITAQEVLVYSTAQDENYQYRVTRLLSRRTGVLVV